MKKRLLWISTVLLTPVIIAIGAIGFLVTTETGLKWLFPIIIRYIPGEVSVKEVRGMLIGPLSISGLRYSNEGITVALDSLYLNWMPYFLTSGEVVVTKLDIRGVTVKSKAEEEAPPVAPRLPQIRLPLNIIVRNAAIRNIRIVRLNGKEDFIVNSVDFSISTGWNTLSIRRLAVKAPDFSVVLDGRVKPVGDYPLRLDTAWSVSRKGLPVIEGSGEIKGSVRRLGLKQKIRRPVNADIDAMLSDVLSTVRWKADADIRRLSLRELRAEWPDVVLKGKLNIEGRLTKYRVALAFDLSGSNIPSGRWTLAGDGDEDSLAIDTFRGKVLGGEVDGRGVIRWQPGLTWNVAVSGKGLDPGTLWSDWPGRLSISAESSGERVKEGLQGTINLQRISGVLRGFPLNAVMLLKIRGEDYLIPGMQVSSGSARITASGRVGTAWDFRWRINAPRLEAILPDGSGSLFGSGTLNGPKESPFVSADINGRNIGYARYRVRNLNADAGLDLRDTVKSQLDIKAGGVTIGKRDFDEVRIRGRGMISDHRLSLALRSGGEALHAVVQGGYGKKVWKGMLVQSSLAHDTFGTWVLEGPGPLSADLQRKEIRAGRWCWSNLNSRLCAQVDWKGREGSSVSIAAKSIPLELFRPALPEDVRLSGSVNANIDLRIEGEGLSGSASARSSPGTISYPLTDTYRSSLAFGGISLDADFSGNTVDMRLAVSLEEGGSIRGAATLPAFSLKVPLMKQEVRGSLYAEMKGLAMLSALVPQIRNARGRFKADVAVGGVLGRPSIKGTAALEQGYAELPRLGISLREVRLAVSGGGTEVAAIEGSAASGPGMITITGNVRPDPGKGWPTNLKIAGQDFKAAGLPEARVYVTPDLDLTIRGHELNVTGEIGVPRADIRLRELASGAVTVSEDVVIVDGRQRKKKEEKWKIYGKVRVVPGEQVSFSGYGLSGNVGGSVTVVDEPAQATAATGELRIVNGQYRAYGQRFAIDRGRLLFAGGPVSNPLLDMRVVRKSDDVTAGISVRGDLKTPRMTLFSSPPMEQAEILSRLILGRPLQSASGEEGQMLYNAARTLSITGGELIARRIGSMFGIRDISVEPGTRLEETSLVLGTYLSPRIYISYGIGLLEAVSRLRVRFDITKRFQLRVESGTESGVDLFYKIER